MTRLQGTLVTALMLIATVAAPAFAQPAAGVFVSIDDSPFGPGDRDTTARIKLQPGESTANTEVWVVYSDSRETTLNGRLNGPGPHGRARVNATDSAGVVTVTFVFPHTDHPTPNVTDRNAQAYRSGKHVFYKWVTRHGSTEVASDVVEFRMPDKLTIVNFGDSYGSGEGASYRDGPKWDNEQCHRSGNSGQSRAVKAYKHGHPETAIAFLNVACSGAGVRDGITGSQKKKGFFEDEDFPTRVKPQVEQAKEWLAQNRYEQLNVAIVSIGGNDIGFGPLVTKFFVEPGNLTDPNDTGSRLARENTAINIAENIPYNYDELKRVFDASFDYDRILVTAYPDPTRDKAGTFCGKPLTIYGVCWGPVEAQNSQSEFEFAFTKILVAMNDTIREKVRTFPGWMFLDGTVARAEHNGLCNCETPYFNTIGASILDQGDYGGTMHPNRTGHANIYLPVVRQALEGEIQKIRRERARERALEIAKEHARRKTEAITALGRPAASPPGIRPVVTVGRKPSVETIQKARETGSKARPMDAIPDERHGDDVER